MEYAVLHNNKYAKDVNFIRFEPDKTDRGILFASQNPDKRVIIEIKDNLISLDKLYTIQAENNNIIYDFHVLPDMVSYARLSKSKEYIYDYMYHAPVATWGLVSILRYHQVSDIIVTEPLTFDIDTLSLVKKADTRIHVIPTLCRTPLQQETEDTGIRHFWVLPQHMYLYEGAIDVLEIIDGNTTRQQAIYEAYAVRGKYETTPMSLLFTGIDLNMPPEVVPLEMVQRRLNCKQKCLSGVETSCAYCSKQLFLWEQLKSRASR